MNLRHVSLCMAVSLALPLLITSCSQDETTTPTDDSNADQSAEAARQPAADSGADTASNKSALNLGKATIRYGDESFELTEFNAKANSVVQISADFMTFELYGSESFSNSIGGSVNGAGVGAKPVGTFATLSLDKPAGDEPIGSITSMGFIGDDSGITLREGTVTVKKFDADGHLVVEFEGKGSPISDPTALVPMSGEIDVTLKVIDHRK